MHIYFGTGAKMATDFFTALSKARTIRRRKAALFLGDLDQTAWQKLESYFTYYEPLAGAFAGRW